ncbi:MAG: Mini-ribonuclease 3 [Bacilli bacterium]|nr:Mini-ribonuclease 3 [Bacilli bacterium]
MNLNSLALAYLGDAIYELYIRKYLISKNIVKVKELQKEAVNYVSAKAQAKFLNKMIEAKFLTDDEVDIVKRARNHKSHSSKSTDIITYKHSTGLEALIGELYLKDNKTRIDEIMNYITEG